MFNDMSSKDAVQILRQHVLSPCSYALEDEDDLCSSRHPTVAILIFFTAAAGTRLVSADRCNRFLALRDHQLYLAFSVAVTGGLSIHPQIFSSRDRSWPRASSSRSLIGRI